jgi:hypothetical protein
MFSAERNLRVQIPLARVRDARCARRLALTVRGR